MISLKYQRYMQTSNRLKRLYAVRFLKIGVVPSNSDAIHSKMFPNLAKVLLIVYSNHTFKWISLKEFVSLGNTKYKSFPLSRC